MSSQVAVVVFPGSNCEHDVAYALGELGAAPKLIWHTSKSLGHADAVVLPGGFAHGDYLRPGALARFSPVMDVVREFAASGGPVLGICNGFQILCEAGLLPGTLQKNRNLRFICAPAGVRVDSNRSVLTSGIDEGTSLVLPINHFDGSYICDARTASELSETGSVVLRYIENPNGSIDDIAGISNLQGNVVGLMPHPERACDPLLGSLDGAALLTAFLAATPIKDETDHESQAEKIRS